MSEIVICDTNAAIHLAIICPEILQTPPAQCKIVLLTIVKTELHRLNKDPEKNKRLGDIFILLLKNVQTFSQLLELDNEKAKRQHQILKKLEEGLLNTNSAPSSHYDRQLLIIAKKNSKKLLTNDKKLHQLSSAFIGIEQTWRTGDALVKLIDLGLISNATVQAGLDKLKKIYKENLHSNCSQIMKSLGFII